MLTSPARYFCLPRMTLYASSLLSSVLSASSRAASLVPSFFILFERCQYTLSLATSRATRDVRLEHLFGQCNGGKVVEVGHLSTEGLLVVAVRAEIGLGRCEAGVLRLFFFFLVLEASRRRRRLPFIDTAGS